MIKIVSLALFQFFYLFWNSTFVYLFYKNITFFSKLFSKLQAIFELSQGEEDLIEDLKLAKKVLACLHI